MQYVQYSLLHILKVVCKHIFLYVGDYIFICGYVWIKINVNKIIYRKDQGALGQILHDFVYLSHLKKSYVNDSC